MKNSQDLNINIDLKRPQIVTKAVALTIVIGLVFYLMVSCVIDGIKQKKRFENISKGKMTDLSRSIENDSTDLYNTHSYARDGSRNSARKQGKIPIINAMCVDSQGEDVMGSGLQLNNSPRGAFEMLNRNLGGVGVRASSTPCPPTAHATSTKPAPSIATT